jgi:hypothetical protein
MIKMHISICAGCRTFEAFCCAFDLTIKVCELLVLLNLPNFSKLTMVPTVLARASGT